MQGDAPPQTGPTVRGYRIERLIGTGGSAAVYEARRLGPRGEGERVACKVLHTTKRNKPLHRELARREAVLGLRVTAGHPNLVEVLDFFDDGQARHCIVMELVDGASVYELREPDRRLPFPVTRRIAVEVLEALACLHDRGVLHRDLSLGNILVTGGGVVKVADFGGARRMEQGLVHTETIQAIPMYAAREAIERLPLDVRVDLFSLGAILYDLVAGVPPCGDQTWTAKMIARNAAGNFAPLPADTPADLDTRITGLIEPDRNKRRPETAAAALALLRGQDQPMASADELAAMVAAVRARRGLEPEGDRPEDELPPGHVLSLEIRAARPRYATTEDELPPGHVLSPRDDEAPKGARPAVHRMISHAADAVPEHVSDPLPDGVAEQVLDVEAERVLDVEAERVLDAEVERVLDVEAERVLDAEAERVLDAEVDAAPRRRVEAGPRRVTGAVSGHADGMIPGRVAECLPGGASGDVGRGPGAARPVVARRRVLMAAVTVCVLVLVALFHDGFRGEQTAIEPTRPGEIPPPVVVPTPAPPVSPVVVTPVPTLESSRHATKSADRPPRKHIRDNRSAKRPAARWRPVPHEREYPPWGQP